jgi:hypothetical protein
MKGVRLIRKSVDKALPVPIVRKKDYEFFEIVNPIAHLITGLYWILLEDVIVWHTASDGSTFDDFETRYDELIIFQRNYLRITEQDFILRYAKFIQGDWDNLIGILSLRDVNDTFTVTQEFIESKAVIHFRCIDAVYWEVYTPDLKLLLILQENFDFW